ncbi:MAG: glycosyltransferase family 10 [Coriobacteriia bacterium]|nr:glycosyltransferase family 10 [Coriobacteriia bacterium]
MASDGYLGMSIQNIRGLVVFDIGAPVFLENRIFDLEHARRYPGAEAGARLAENLRKREVESVTADIYLADMEFEGPIALLTSESTPFTERLLQDPRILPVACLSLESPIVDRSFYRSIRSISERFDHVFLYPGTRARATGGATFHDISWPYPNLGSVEQGRPWPERGFLTMISSNKRVYAWPSPMFGLRHPRSFIRRLLTKAETVILRYSDSWFRTELYVDRMRAIEHFSACRDFDLYGRGWSSNEYIRSPQQSRAVRKAYRGEIDPLEKLDVLSEYKFSLCYENTSFPGYITEKIFDCFAAGSIPVYLGAPDVAESIPPECFIDAREFENMRSLERFLRSMSAETAEQYLEAATAFVRSPQAARFSQERFVEVLTSTLLECLHCGTSPARV